MKKFQIEYEGKTVQHIEADKMKYDRRHGNTLFFRRESERLVAIVPRGYMVIELKQIPIVETYMDHCTCAIHTVIVFPDGIKICQGCHKQVKNEENAG